MKPIARLVCIGIFGVLVACGERAFVIQDGRDGIQKSFEVEKTDSNLNHRNTYVIEMPNQAPVIIGSLNARDIELTFTKETHTYHLTGTYEIFEKGKSAHILSTRKFDLSGDSQGDHPDLYPNFNDAREEERVRARLTCLAQEADGTCSKVILDLIVKKAGYKENLAVQFEINLETKTSVEQKLATEKIPPKKETTPAHPPTSPQPQAPTPEKQPEIKTPITPLEPKKEGAPAPAPSPAPSTPAPAPAKEVPNVDEGSNITVNETPEHDEDENEEGGLYVGTLYQDTDVLFMNVDENPEKQESPQEGSKVPGKKETAPTPRPQPAPIKTPPAKVDGSDQGRARDQAVGSAANGRLERGTSLKEAISTSKMASALELIYPARDRFYGTWEMIDTLEKMSQFLSSKDVLPGYKMAVGDISQKNGGLLVGSAHKSHQCGLDADVAYPLINLKSLAFIDVVANGQVSQSLRLRETYQLFEFAQKSLRNVDRIFVDGQIKKALCDMAQKQGMLANGGRAVEVLRRLRPAAGHDNHFHLRIRCSPQQPRCRMMAEPAAGSGC